MDGREALWRRQRLIGIDVGTKTLGLALSDVGRMIASSLETIRRTTREQRDAAIAQVARAVAAARETFRAS